MAFLLNTGTQQYVPLAPHHTFGRLQNRVDTFLHKPYVSKLHTTVEWHNQHWLVKNLGRNGTYVNGVVIPANESIILAVGDEIHFAELHDAPFVVEDLSPPCDFLWPLQTSGVPQPITLSRYHLLPNEKSPLMAVFCNDQNWYIESISQDSGNIAQSLQSGDEFEVGEQRWQFRQVDLYGPTEARSAHNQSLIDSEFVFELSQDEESTNLTLVRAEQKFDLGIRSHHYLLLQLARHRLYDIDQGLAEAEQGWRYTDELIRELGLDETHINIQIFRARKQVSDALPLANVQGGFIQRRNGKVRLVCDKFVIYKGGKLLHPPHAHYRNDDQKYMALSIQ